VAGWGARGVRAGRRGVGGGGGGGGDGPGRGGGGGGGAPRLQEGHDDHGPEGPADADLLGLLDDLADHQQERQNGDRRHDADERLLLRQQTDAREQGGENRRKHREAEAQRRAAGAAQL